MSDVKAWTCAQCGFPGTADEMQDSYDRSNGAPVDVKVHDDCIDEWANRVDDYTREADAESEREEQAYEDAVDRSLSEWKDEGKVGMPRPVVRRWVRR
jgi:hypothetical protein